MNAVHDVVVDDYCEFNVQVLQTTTVPPTTFPNRVTAAIGSDVSPGSSTLFGIAREVDTGDGDAEDYARIFSGVYAACNASGTPCGTGPQFGDGNELAGANSTLERWAFAIGGTAAHEAGHTFGLTHTNGQTVLPGELPLETHIMPAGSTFSAEARIGARRHFGDTEFSVLAANVGLSLQTLHNWDLTNPNSVNAESLRIEVLSTSPTLTVSWAYDGGAAPWINPTVSGPLTTRDFHGTTYNVYNVDWSVDHAWDGGSAGIVPPAGTFHVGIAFTEVDFGVPNEVQACLTQLTTLEQCELKEGNLTRKRADLERQEDAVNACQAQGGDYACCPVPVSACVIGTTSLDIRDRTKSVGNVAADKLTLGVQANVGGFANVFGDALLRNNSRINGSLEIKGALTTQSGAVVSGGVHRPGTSVQAVLPNDVVTAGTTPLTINSGQTATVVPGNYGVAVFRARSRVMLRAGTYNFASWTVEGPGNVTLDTSLGPVLINVKGNVVLNSGAVFSAGSAANVRLYGTGSSVNVAPSETFPGTIVAPLANLTLASSVTIGGCVGGKVVVIDTDSRINGTGSLSGGKQACETRRNELNTQQGVVDQQLAQQTLTCQQNESSFRTCTGVPAPAETPGMLRMQARRDLQEPAVDAKLTAPAEPGIGCSFARGANGPSAWFALALSGSPACGDASPRRERQ